ncbi:hypothetical protein [Chitinimonas sp.]|uniref:DUF6969 family protein n=1 Tax=Chitinimonas sp. TaxID=1934313 RepID=UPI0035AF9BC5
MNASVNLTPLPFEVAAPAWTQLDRAQLKPCWKAAGKLVEQLSKLGDAGSQAVQATIGDACFVEWDHYPDDDVSDKRHASQYFYHAHPGLQRPFSEHGHFHLFIHAEKLGLARVRDGRRPAPAHLFAVSMNAQGLPQGLFTVNRWVTKGPWLAARQVLTALDQFNIKGREGVPEVNAFLVALCRLYRPQLVQLLAARDAALATHGAGRDRRTVFADPNIEVLSFCPIDLVADIEALEALLG